MAGELTFPALRGLMGDREFYMTTLTLKEAARFFDTTPADLPAEQRAQRALNTSRVPEITRYLIEHDTDWVFASLTVSYDGEATFTPENAHSSCGTLAMDSGTAFVIVDGQHRLAAIKAALVENSTLGSQNVGIMLLAFEDLQRNQQVFSDLNRTVQKTSRSLDILYNHNDPMNDLVMTVAAQVPIFQRRVEKNSQSLALRSPKFVTLSSLYDACQQLLGGPANAKLLDDGNTAAAVDFCVAYWTYITDLILPWSQVVSGEIRPSEARSEYVAAHSVSYFALGLAGADVLQVDKPSDWLVAELRLGRLDGLRDIDWLKTNPEWQGIIMLGFSIVTRRQTRAATARFIDHKLDPERFPRPVPVLLADE